MNKMEYPVDQDCMKRRTNGFSIAQLLIGFHEAIGLIVLVVTQLFGQKVMVYSLEVHETERTKSFNTGKKKTRKLEVFYVFY